MPVIFGPTISTGRVYRSKKKNDDDEEKRAIQELQSILNAKNRKSCDCEAQLHDLLENCLSCGRLTCVAEGPGKCFSCSSIVLTQEQRDRLKNHVDMVQSLPTPNQIDQRSEGPRVKIIDNQFDQFSIDNKRHLREEDKLKLKRNLEELQAKRYQRKLVLNVDIDNLVAGASSKPLVDDYEGEMRKLQISEPAESRTNPTLVEALDSKTKKEAETTSRRVASDARNPADRKPPTTSRKNFSSAGDKSHPRRRDRGSRLKRDARPANHRETDEPREQK